MPKNNGTPGYDFALWLSYRRQADRLRLWERQARASGETGRAWQLRAKRRKLMQRIRELEHDD